MVQERYPSSELLAAGWSLGGNILVRYVGEEGDQCPISAAASLCNPLDLVSCLCTACDCCVTVQHDLSAFMTYIMDGHKPIALGAAPFCPLLQTVHHWLKYQQQQRCIAVRLTECCKAHSMTARWQICSMTSLS